MSTMTLGGVNGETVSVTMLAPMTRFRGSKSLLKNVDAASSVSAITTRSAASCPDSFTDGYLHSANSTGAVAVPNSSALDSVVLSPVVGISYSLVPYHSVVISTVAAVIPSLQDRDGDPPAKASISAMASVMEDCPLLK